MGPLNMAVFVDKTYTSPAIVVLGASGFVARKRPAAEVAMEVTFRGGEIRECLSFDVARFHALRWMLMCKKTRTQSSVVNMRSMTGILKHVIEGEDNGEEG